MSLLDVKLGLVLLAASIECHLIRRQVDDDGKDPKTVYTFLDESPVPVPNLNFKPSGRGPVISTAINSTDFPFLDVKPIPKEGDSSDNPYLNVKPIPKEGDSNDKPYLDVKPIPEEGDSSDIPYLDIKPIPKEGDSSDKPYLDIKPIPEEGDSSDIPDLDVKPIPEEGDYEERFVLESENYDLNQSTPVVSVTETVPDQTTITINPESQTVFEGNAAHFNCAVTTTKSNVDVRWYRKNQDMMNAMGDKSYDYTRYGFETGQEPEHVDTGLRTFWSTLMLYDVAMSDFGLYICDVGEAHLELDAQLMVQVRPTSMKKVCRDNRDCSWRSNYKCINLKCQAFTTRTSSIFTQPTTTDETFTYTTSLKFVVAAFLCGALGITIVMCVVLFREVCYKVWVSPRRNRNTNRRFVYVIGRDNGLMESSDVTTTHPIDKPPNYETCVSTSPSSPVDETPPPSYRALKPRNVRPPAYDVFETSDRRGHEACHTTCHDHGATSTVAEETPTTAETTFPQGYPRTTSCP